MASWLSAVPGKVIVIIESCGSGAAVYEEGVPENSVNNFDTAFGDMVIKEFEEADTDDCSEKIYYYPPTGDEITEYTNTGEFRKSKFYVLCASRYQENSWGTESGPYNYFTKWLTDGIGTSGSMPADTNSDGKATLHELFSYIKEVGDTHPFYYYGSCYQHVQVYPTYSSYVLFKR